MRSSLKEVDCNVAQALEQIGEWWTLMIIRDVFSGTRTFDGFQKSLKISTSVLSLRLEKLTNCEILERKQSKSDGRSFEYLLTERGLELYPLIIALMQWGEKWAPNGRGARMEVVDRKTGRAIKGAQVISDDGAELRPWEAKFVAGPGASESLRALLQNDVDYDYLPATQ